MHSGVLRVARGGSWVKLEAPPLDARPGEYAWREPVRVETKSREDGKWWTRISKKRISFRIYAEHNNNIERSLLGTWRKYILPGHDVRFVTKFIYANFMYMVVEKNKSISRILSGYSTRPTMTLQEIVHPWYKVLLIWWGLLVQNMILPPLFLQR